MSRKTSYAGALLRGVLFNLYFLALTLIMGVCAIPVRIIGNEKIALRYAQIWSFAVIKGLRIFCGVKIVIEGAEHLKKSPSSLVVAQHQSFFDGFIWMTLLNAPSYVLKKELLSIPLVGPMLSLSGMIPIDRKGGLKALKFLLHRVKNYWIGTRQIILFPQGTRVPYGETVRLQKGVVPLAQLARDQNVPVLPAVTNSGAFWPHNPWVKYPGVLKVVIGAPLAVPEQGNEILSEIERRWHDLESRNP